MFVQYVAIGDHYIKNEAKDIHVELPKLSTAAVVPTHLISVIYTPLLLIVAAFSLRMTVVISVGSVAVDITFTRLLSIQALTDTWPHCSLVLRYKRCQSTHGGISSRLVLLGL